MKEKARIGDYTPISSQKHGKTPSRKSRCPNFIRFQLGLLRQSFKTIIHQPRGRCQYRKGRAISVYHDRVHQGIDIFYKDRSMARLQGLLKRRTEVGRWAIVQLSRGKRM
jgi:hypothetical protein